MIEQYDYNLILDYIEGVLAPEEAAGFEQLLGEDRELRLLVEQLAEDKRLIKEMPIATAPPEIMDRINQRLERQMLLDTPAPHPMQDAAVRRFELGRWAAYGSVAAMLGISAMLIYQSLVPPTGDTTDPDSVAMGDVRKAIEDSIPLLETETRSKSIAAADEPGVDQLNSKLAESSPKKGTPQDREQAELTRRLRMHEGIPSRAAEHAGQPPHSALPGTSLAEATEQPADLIVEIFERPAPPAGVYAQILDLDEDNQLKPQRIAQAEQSAPNSARAGGGTGGVVARDFAPSAPQADQQTGVEAYRPSKLASVSQQDSAAKNADDGSSFQMAYDPRGDNLIAFNNAQMVVSPNTYSQIYIETPDILACTQSIERWAMNNRVEVLKFEDPQQTLGLGLASAERYRNTPEQSQVPAETAASAPSASDADVQTPPQQKAAPDTRFKENSAWRQKASPAPNTEPPQAGKRTATEADAPEAENLEALTANPDAQPTPVPAQQPEYFMLVIRQDQVPQLLESLNSFPTQQRAVLAAPTWYSDIPSATLSAQSTNGVAFYGLGNFEFFYRPGVSDNASHAVGQPSKDQAAEPTPRQTIPAPLIDQLWDEENLFLSPVRPSLSVPSSLNVQWRFLLEPQLSLHPQSPMFEGSRQVIIPVRIRSNQVRGGESQGMGEGSGDKGQGP